MNPIRDLFHLRITKHALVVIEFRTPLVFSNSECELCNCHLQFGASQWWTCQHCFSTESMPLDILNTNYMITEFNMFLWWIGCAPFSEVFNGVCTRNFKTIVSACTCITNDVSWNFGRCDMLGEILNIFINFS